MRRTKHQLRAARNPGIDPVTRWTVSTEFKAPSGRLLTPGTEVRIHGERGRFRFVKHVITGDGTEWCEFIGGTRGVQMWRSFRPDRIRTVHRTRKTLSLTDARELVNEKNRQKRGTP